MGVTSGVRCMICKRFAPQLGDFGYIGYPSLSTDKRSGMQSFGYIFQGFRAIGMVTTELASYYRFLQGHDGHKLSLFVESEEEDVDWDAGPFDGEELEPPRVAEGHDEALMNELVTPWSSPDSASDTLAHYEVECPGCNDIQRTGNYELVSFAEPLELTPHRCQLFLERVYVSLEDAFYRAEPFSNADLCILAEFLEHAAHGPIARFVPRDT